MNATKLARRFWSELAGGLPRKTADSSLRIAYEFQKKRLDDEGLILRVKTEPCGHFPEGYDVAGWKDLHYRTTMVAQTTRYQRMFYRKGQTKPVRTDSDNYLLYTNVTDCRDYAISGEESYVCPNCGAVSTLGELQGSGCSYCGTRFEMSELYPRVTGYFAVKNVGGTKEEVNGQIRRCIRPFLIVFLILGVLAALLAIDPAHPGQSVWNGIFYVGGAAVLAAVVGYLLWCARTLGKLFSQAGKSLPQLSALGSPKKFTERMKQYSGEFSYEYFTDKVVSILKTIIYSSEDGKLPNYLGGETKRFDHVVESSFSGALALKSFTIDNNIVTVRVEAFMENFYSDHGRICKKSEKIPITVQKDLSGEINYHFNIRAVKCNACGGSFDGTKEYICPYCGTALDMRKQDWVVSRIG